MAVAPIRTTPLTYEEYMAEGEVNLRYDILDGVRLVTNPTRRHQRILFKLAQCLERFAQQTHAGEVLLSPCDLLISRSPLRIRQPDVSFISGERLAQNPAPDDPSPLDPAPELVVEIVSPSDTAGVLSSKLDDYRRVNVQECWVVRPDAQTVAVLRLTAEAEERAALYGEGDVVRSLTFPDLTVAVTDIFAE